MIRIYNPKRFELLHYLSSLYKLLIFSIICSCDLVALTRISNNTDHPIPQASSCMSIARCISGWLGTLLFDQVIRTERDIRIAGPSLYKVNLLYLQPDIAYHWSSGRTDSVNTSVLIFYVEDFLTHAEGGSSVRGALSTIDAVSIKESTSAQVPNALGVVSCNIFMSASLSAHATVIFNSIFCRFQWKGNNRSYRMSTENCLICIPPHRSNIQLRTQSSKRPWCRWSIRTGLFNKSTTSGHCKPAMFFRYFP